MRIERLRLENFRNIAALELEPGPGANIVCGDNAQGKTNILEAVWLCTGSRSFRGSKDSEFIRFGSETASIHLAFEAEQRVQEADIVYGAGRKQVRVNGVKQGGTGALAGRFCAVLFAPDHLRMVKQGPEHRRRMLDTSLCQALPKYAGILESYQKIVRQRASLLRDCQRNAALLDVLDVWDKSLVEYGSYITGVRAGYVKRLSKGAAAVYGGISGGREALSVSYRLSGGEAPEGYTREDFRRRLEEALVRNRGEDIAQGKTTAGPHRDDMEIAIDGRSARSFGSQGQQRSCVLALKLAECSILEERNGEPPVVLLDDVMSELDEYRRGYLLNRLEGRQIVITCCDEALFQGLEGGRVYAIRQGAICP